VGPLQAENKYKVYYRTEGVLIDEVANYWPATIGDGFWEYLAAVDYALYRTLSKAFCLSAGAYTLEEYIKNCSILTKNNCIISNKATKTIQKIKEVAAEVVDHQLGIKSEVAVGLVFVSLIHCFSNSTRVWVVDELAPQDINDDFDEEAVGVESPENYNYYKPAQNYIGAAVQNLLGLQIFLYACDQELPPTKLRKIAELCFALLEKYKVILKKDIRVYRDGPKLLRFFAVPAYLSDLWLSFGVLKKQSVTLDVGSIKYRYGWSCQSIVPLIVQNKAGLEPSDINPAIIFELDSVAHVVDSINLNCARQLINTHYNIDVTKANPLERERGVISEKILHIKASAIRLQKELKQQTHEFKLGLEELGVTNNICNILSGYFSKPVKKRRAYLQICFKNKEEWEAVYAFVKTSISRVGGGLQGGYKRLAEELHDVSAELKFSSDELNKKQRLYLKYVPNTAKLTQLFIKKQATAQALKENSSLLSVERSNLHKLEELAHMYNFLANCSGVFYIQHYFDFRGRVYSRSKFSVINTK
jgi:hypothetical protein